MVSRRRRFVVGGPAWQSWERAFQEAQGCPFRASLIQGSTYDVAVAWRAHILGPRYRRPRRAELNEYEIAELEAAIQAKINLGLMADRFGVSRPTLTRLARRYGLSRCRRPREFRRGSNAR